MLFLPKWVLTEETSSEAKVTKEETKRIKLFIFWLPLSDQKMIQDKQITWEETRSLLRSTFASLSSSSSSSVNSFNWKLEKSLKVSSRRWRWRLTWSLPRNFNAFLSLLEPTALIWFNCQRLRERLGPNFLDGWSIGEWGFLYVSVGQIHVPSLFVSPFTHIPHVYIFIWPLANSKRCFSN